MSQAFPFNDELLDEIVEAELDAQLLLRTGAGNLQVTHANKAARSLFHVHDADLGQVRLQEVVPPSVVDLLNSTCDAVGVSGRPVNIDDVEWPDARGKGSSWLNFAIRRLYGRVCLTCIDVTARHRAGEELRLSQSHYRMLAEYSSDVVFASDRGLLTWVAPSVKSVLGWKPSDMVGRHIADFVHPDDSVAMRGAAQLLDVGQPGRYEARFRHRNGNYVWLAITARAQFDEAGHVAGRIGSGRDISHRIAIERALRESERSQRSEHEMLRAILDSSLDPQVVLTADDSESDFAFVECNTAATSYLRTPRRQLLGRTLSDLFPSAASELTAGWMRRVMATGEPFTAQAVQLFPSIADGQERHFDICITGMSQGVTFTWRDVTKYVTATTALAESEELFRLTMQNSPVALCLIAPDGSFVEVNRSLCELLGRDQEEMRRTTWQELTHHEDLDVDLYLVRDVAEGRRDGYRLTKRYLRPDGTVVWGELSVSCVREADGKVRYFISQILDVTELAEQRQALAESEKHYRLLAEHTSDVVATTDGDSRFEWVSPSVTAEFGWVPDDLVGQSVGSLIDEEHWPRVAAVLAASSPGMSMSGVFRARRRNGTFVWVDATATTTTDDDDRILRVVRVRDVDNEYRANQRVRRSEARFRTAMNSSPVGTALVDDTGRLTQVNASLCQLLGRDAGDLLGQALWDLTTPNAEQQAHWDRVVAGDVESQTDEVELRHSDGSVLYVQQALAPVKDTEGRRTSVVAQFIDVTAARQARALLEFQANHDVLTELKNRRAVLAAMAATLSHPSRSGSRLAVLYCDLDRFKPVNDADGHGVGDEVLVEAGRRIRRCVRQGDVVGRIGGDEFVVVLMGVHGEADARMVAEQVRAAVAEPMLVADVTVQVTLSVGVAIADPGDNPDDVLTKADRALYAAKNTGRDRVVAYSVTDGDALGGGPA